MPTLVTASDAVGQPAPSIDKVKNINDLRSWLQDEENCKKLTKKINPDSESGCLGRGEYGAVKLIQIENKKIVTVKVMVLNTYGNNQNENKEIAKRQRNEYEILAAVSSPFIVEYYGFYPDFDRNLLFIFMEHCEKRSLSNQKFKQEEIPILFAQMCLGISCLHNGNILHRDIKPDNILLTQQHVIKIADFGTGCMIDLQTSTANSVVGTPVYMAPEIYKAFAADLKQCNSYTNKVDIWSLGCVLRFLVDGNHPFDADDILQGNYKPIPFVSHVTNELKNLLDRMLKVDPNARPNIDEILDDPFVAPSLFFIYQSFPQLKNVLDESLDVVDYVPEIESQIVTTGKWERMKPVQTYADGRSSVIDLSKYPRDDNNFNWIFDSWREMATGNFNQNMSLFLPPVHLPSDGDFGGCFVDIKLIRRFTREKPSRDLRMQVRFSPYPRNPEIIHLPLRGVCNIIICCSENDKRVKPPTEVELTSRDDFCNWFIFHDFRWNTLDPEKPPAVCLSFASRKTCD